MTKAENRAAAKAYHRARMERWRREDHARAVAEDLEHLDKLRSYLILGRKVHISGRDLIEAIDDYAGKLTGDRTILHAKSSSIG